MTTTFACPFCGRTAAMTEEAVMHSIPICDDFARLTPLKYLEAVNDRLLGKDEADRQRAEFDRKRGN